MSTQGVGSHDVEGPWIILDDSIQEAYGRSHFILTSLLWLGVNQKGHVIGNQLSGDIAMAVLNTVSTRRVNGPLEAARAATPVADAGLMAVQHQRYQAVPGRLETFVAFEGGRELCCV